MVILLDALSLESDRSLLMILNLQRDLQSTSAK